MIAYIRVSTDEQSDSVDRQRQLLLDHAKAHNLEVTDVIVDDGYSGSSERRPGWQRLLGQLVAGAPGVVAVDLSRLHRNAADAIRFANEYLVRRGLRLVLLAEQVDLGTAAGKLQYNIMVSAAQFHSDQTKEKTRRALASKRARGEKLGGTVPYGYRCVDGKLVAHEAEQMVLAQMRALQAQGLSSAAIAVRLVAAGVLTKTGQRCWQPKTVRRILKRAS